VLNAHLQICARGLCTRRAGRKDWQWQRWQRQRASKQYKSPLSPLYTSSVKERGLRHGARRGSGSPLTGREIKNYRATHETVRAQSKWRI
jgi:hypothetical protein